MFIDYTFCKSKSPKLHSIKIMSVYMYYQKPPFHFIPEWTLLPQMSR